MRITVRLFAALRERAGWSERELDVPDGAAVADVWSQLITFTELSALSAAVNAIATILKHRAPGMSLDRLPLFVWAILTFSVLLILALPTIAAAVTMLLTDRHFGTHFFDPSHGGSPL